jgi:hypothetical protein
MNYILLQGQKNTRELQAWQGIVGNIGYVVLRLEVFCMRSVWGMLCYGAVSYTFI